MAPWFRSKDALSPTAVRLRELETELVRLRSENAALSRAVETGNSTAEVLNGTIASLTDRQRDLASQLTAVVQQRDQLESRVAELLPRAEQSEFHHAAFRVGVLSKLQMIASDVGLFRRLREHALPDVRWPEALRLRYLDLLEQALTNTLHGDAPLTLPAYDPDIRLAGWDWPSTAHTMIGRARLRSLRDHVEDVLARGVPGDLLEAGVWRGGATIFMRGLLAAYGIADRKVWVADSFAGLPPPDEERHPADKGDPHHTFQQLAVSLEAVKANFATYNLLDDQVRFLPGWFKDTLPDAPIERLAILRLDGDMYGSTMDILQALYRRVTPGGYVIVDDYILAPCRSAVSDFRRDQGITDAIQEIDGTGVFWQVS